MPSGRKKLDMMFRCIYILSFLLLSAPTCFSQSKTKSLQGKVTFVTSNNVYVKFDDTKSISIGDTLNLSTGNTLSPCMIVKNKSSTSCVATIVIGRVIKIGDPVIYQSATDIAEKSVDNQNNSIVTKPMKPAGKPRNEKIRGSISAASYSNISSSRGNSTRTMYRLSFSAPHINNSKLSLETYMNYRQTFMPKDSLSIRPKDVFNVYSLALQYDVNSSMSIVLGRKINPKVSSIGAIDGIQIEKSFGNFYTGILAGFRPDIMDYSFNPDLIQYGAFIGLKSDTKALFSQTTLGVLEQNNNGSIDRRYAYFQHTSSIGGKVNIFSSVELDLYNQVNGDSIGKPRWTNIYVSAAYRINKKIDFSLAYNSRKQIVYYETFKTEIERILDDDIARQGIRFNVNFRPFKYVGIGGSYSKRFQSDDLNNSDNINGYFSLSKIPWIGGRLYINMNRNTSSYMETNILSFRHSRSLIEMKLEADLYYRIVNYMYLATELLTEQRYYGASLTYRMAKKMTLSVLGELAATPTEDNYRVNARISKNF